MSTKSFILALLAVLPLGTLSHPLLQTRQDGPGHSYECDGVAATRKQALTAQGANAQDLAIAILETGCSMTGDYKPVGDQSPDGTPKTGDAANYGLFKNNWGNIRMYCAQFAGKSADEYADGIALNSDDAAAITCQHEQIAAQGVDGFYQTQRGVAGEGPDYGNAITFIEDFLNDGHLTDDSVTYYVLHGV